jgi:spermidine/putrescine transport system substrate-binding protein
MKNKIFLGVSGVKGVKAIVFLFLCLLMILPLSSCYNKENREEILKVYNWADYIDEDVLANFPKWYEQQTGKKIRVIYQTFDINEVMLTKIERGHEDYDVVCPSEYIIERMLRKDLLLPINTFVYSIGIAFLNTLLCILLGYPAFLAKEVGQIYRLGINLSIAHCF